MESIKNIINKNQIKTVLILLLSFFMVKTMAPKVFMADTPRINPLFIASILNTPSKIATIPGKFLSSLSSFRLFNFELQTTPELPIQQNRQNEVANIKVDPVEIAKVRQVTPPPNVIFREIMKGVSTGVNAQTGEKYINVKAGTKYVIVGSVIINGKKYPKIKFIEE
jgi:hypothetical protein